MHTLDQHWSAYYKQGLDFSLISYREIFTFLAYTDPTAQAAALDIGCGTGQLTRELYHRGFRVLGVDASKSSVQIAKSLTTVPSPELEYQHLDIERDDLSKLQHAPYGLITCKLVYAFIKDKPAFIDKVSNLLAPNGSFIVLTPRPELVPPEKKAIAVDQEAIDLLSQKLRCVANYEDGRNRVIVCRGLF